MRASTLTSDDVTEKDATLDALNGADESLRDLWDRLSRRGDEVRCGHVRLALIDLGRAIGKVEQAFR